MSEYHARKSAIRTALQQQGITLDLPKKKTARHSLVRQYIKTGKDCEGGQVDLDTVVIAAVERHFLRLHGYYRPLVYGRCVREELEMCECFDSLGIVQLRIRFQRGIGCQVLAGLVDWLLGG